VICGAARGYVICGAGGWYVIAEVADATGGWLWRNGKIDSMVEVVLDWLGRLVVTKSKG
jgi:hypothetical protein